jgi:hypothetical protein
MKEQYSKELTVYCHLLGFDTQLKRYVVRGNVNILFRKQTFYEITNLEKSIDDYQCNRVLKPGVLKTFFLLATPPIVNKKSSDPKDISCDPL